MKNLKPSATEKITASLPVGIAATSAAIHGITFTPLAAFVPFLFQSLATGRQTKRVDESLENINEILKLHEDKLKNLSDSQYKLINEVVFSVFQTVNQEKILFLNAVVSNTITQDEINSKNVDYISRVIRDISADEIKFIKNSFSYRGIIIGDKIEGDEAEKILFIKPDSSEEIIVSGLVNMGLLYSKNSVWGGIKFEFSPVVVKLLAIFKEINSP